MLLLTVWIHLGLILQGEGDCLICGDVLLIEQRWIPEVECRTQGKISIVVPKVARVPLEEPQGVVLQINRHHGEKLFIKEVQEVVQRGIDDIGTGSERPDIVSV